MKKTLILTAIGAFLLAGCSSQPGSTTTGESALAPESMQQVEESPTTDTAMLAVAPTFTVTGNNFSFDVKEMRVKTGDTVTVTFKNAEGTHDWVLDEFNAKTKQIEAGEEETITFVADKAGTYEYYCSVGQHRQNGMVGTLIVE